MRYLQERRIWRRLLLSPVLSFFLLVVVFLVSRSVYDIYKKDQTARINRVESERKLTALQDKEKWLQSEIKKLKTNRGVEEELRNKFQITKGGEEVIVVVDDQSAATKNAEQVSSSGNGYWEQLIKLFGF